MVAVPNCGNCGAHVSRDYVRVWKPEDVDEVRACPNCPDAVRRGSGEIREPRAARGIENGKTEIGEKGESEVEA